jgi:hypothetical protein
VACLYAFARQAFGELQGRVVTLLFALTPGVLMMAGTYMNHVPTLFLATAALAATAQWEMASGRAAQRWALVIGLATGLMATVRPLDAVVAALVIGLFQLRVAQQVPRRAPELLWTIVGGVAGVAPLLYANWATNGSAFRFGYDVMWGEGHRIGLHADPRGNEHTLTRAVGHAVRYVSELNFSAMAWPLPALAIAFVSLTAMLRTTRWDALVFGWAGAQVVAYGLYWGEGEFLGPRFLFTVLPMLVIVLARAPFILAERSGPAAGRGMATVIALCMLVTWVVPAGLYTLWGGAGQVKATRQFLRLDVRRAVADARLTHALVFVREPFSGRLLKRMWGVGVPRGEAASLMASSDACSLVDGVRAAELDTAATRDARAARVRSAALLFQQGPQLIRTRDPQIRINSMASISPACRAEMDGERYVSMSFGAALPHETIMPDGRLGGNVVYAADLGEHNEVLRGRFGDRAWYRLEAVESPSGVLRATLVAY